MEISLLGGFTFAAPSETVSGTNPRWTGNAGLSYGASVALNIFGSSFDLESGVFSIQAVSEQDVNGASTIRTFRSMEIPLLLRFHFDDAVSIGLGVYSASSQGIVDPNFQSNDFGLLFSLAARMHLFSSLFLVVDARYQNGMSNLAIKPGDLLNTRSIQTLSGFSVVF